MKKGSQMSVKSRKRVSLGLKKYFETNPVWNKGKKFSKYDEPSCKRLRKDPKYYLNELRLNALRRNKYGYDLKRIEQINERKKYYEEITGKGRPRHDWTEEEVAWLIENQKKPHLEICAHLKRSWSSVQHKISRLGLQKYNKWT